jgi:hypothetical protein
MKQLGVVVSRGVPCNFYGQFGVVLLAVVSFYFDGNFFLIEIFDIWVKRLQSFIEASSKRL